MPDSRALIDFRDGPPGILFLSRSELRLVDTKGAVLANGILRRNDVETVVASTGSPVTNTSTVTWVNHLTTSFLLAAGTWKVTLLYIGVYLGDTGTTVFFEFRVSAPVVGTTTASAAAGNGRVTVSATVSGNVVSDGAVATNFTAQFQKSAGVTDTPRAESGSIFAICQRVS